MPLPIIAEAASENGSKQKRGRPRKTSDTELCQAKMVSPGLSDRQLRERSYAYTGLALLIDEDHKLPDRYEWLCHGETLRVSLLALLGRMFTDGQADEDDVRALAGELCKHRPNTKVAMQRLRDHFGRRRESRRHDEGLALRILKDIGEWQREHPDVTDEDVCHHLEWILAAMRSG